MIDFLRPFRALTFAAQRFWSRRAARQLLSQRLPHGLLAAPRTQLLSLRVPPLVQENPSAFLALPLGAQAIRGRSPGLLFRLSALPPPPLELAVLREAKAAPSLEPRLLTSSLLELVPPLRSRVLDLGVVRPRIFRLDAELRLPGEADPLRFYSDAPPPARVRRVRPRTPLARAPLVKLRPRSLRLDPRTLESANESILPLEQRKLAWGWVRSDFRREIVDVQWMASERISFLAPRPVEWFTMWWFQHDEVRPGGREAVFYELPKELDWALEECKEQMLIRRDVKKDETELEPSRFKSEEVGVSMASVEQVPLSEIIPKKPWIQLAGMLAPLPFATNVRDVYLQWRTLIGALEER